MDLVHDRIATGRKLRILTIVDTHSRYCPAADPRFGYRGEDVVQTLERVCPLIGYPKTIRVDKGSEFISRDLDLWADANEATLDLSRPGPSPPTTGSSRPSNSKPRAECLNAHWFPTLGLCAGKAGGPAQGLQRGQTARRDRRPRPDRRPQSQQRGQPAAAIRRPNSGLRWAKAGAQSMPDQRQLQRHDLADPRAREATAFSPRTPVTG